MKKYSIIMLSLLDLAGCNYLDKTPDDYNTDEMV